MTGWRCHTPNSASIFPGYGAAGSEQRRSAPATAAGTVVNGEPGPPAPLPADPFRNLREQREKKKLTTFEYDPFSINKNLID